MGAWLIARQETPEGVPTALEEVCTQWLLVDDEGSLGREKQEKRERSGVMGVWEWEKKIM